MKIKEIRNNIKTSISDCLKKLNFLIDKDSIFYHFEEEIIRIISIAFLDKRHASYFNSNTASFSLNLGVYFNFEGREDIYPEDYEAHIRACLIRDFYQKNPMQIKGFSLFHPERKRRDIWWVDKDASNLDELLKNASRLINNKGIKWLDTFSDISYTLNYLKKKKQIDSVKGGPFGFGSIDSPNRMDLIHKLKKKYQA